MSKMDYDLDSSGGIMAEIQALIKPEGSSKPVIKKDLHSYYKRPGRGHNHDMCDACDEGGDLICCDRCPASFHLGCHDPPLYEEDIPMGIWLCHNCRMTQKNQFPLNAQNRTASTDTKVENSTRAETPPPNQTNNEIESGIVAKRNLRHRSGSRISISSDASGGPDKVPTKSVNNQAKIQQPASQPPPAQSSLNSVVDDKKKLSPLEELIKAASIMNPKQFELPREMELYVQFPGNDRIEPSGTKNCATKKMTKNNTKTKPHELDAHGLVPLPAKTCFYCRKSCKKAPLIACDYCPLYFHQDCLDPPMTALPTGLWMCPNHPEQFIDWKLVSSVSATERVKLWNRFAGPVDQDTVKSEFFRKVHSKNPPFRFKIKASPRERIQIPPMIEYHYKNPPSLLPSLRDVLRCEVVQKKGEAKELIHEDLSRLVEEELKALQDANQKIVDFNSSDDYDNQTFDPVDDEDIDGDDNQTNNNQNDIEMEEEVTAQHTECEPINVDGFENSIPPHLKNDLEKAEHELKDFDMSLIKLLAYQRLQQIINEHPDVVHRYQQQAALKGMHEALIRHEPIMSLPSQLLTKEDIERIARKFAGDSEFTDPKTRSPSPIQKQRTEGGSSLTSSSSSSSTNTNSQQQQQPEIEKTNATTTNNNSGLDLNRMKTNHFYYGNGFDELKTDVEKAQVIAARLEMPISKSNVRARAVLTPVGDILSGRRWFTRKSMDGAVFMRYRNFTIGTGPGSDLHLPSTGNCAHISNNHATIFYDDVTQSFELLNYSEFGTEINGLVYSCDFTEYPLTPARQPVEDPKAFYKNVQNIVDKRRGVIRPELKIDTNLKLPAPELPVCQCNNKPVTLINGWEGAAVLTHGTLIRFGCLAFVFSICNLDQR